MLIGEFCSAKNQKTDPPIRELKVLPWIWTVIDGEFRRATCTGFGKILRRTSRGIRERVPWGSATGGQHPGADDPQAVWVET